MRKYLDMKIAFLEQSLMLDETAQPKSDKQGNALTIEAVCRALTDSVSSKVKPEQRAQILHKLDAIISNKNFTDRFYGSLVASLEKSNPQDIHGIVESWGKIIPKANKYVEYPQAIDLIFQKSNDSNCIKHGFESLASISEKVKDFLPKCIDDLIKIMSDKKFGTEDFQLLAELTGRANKEYGIEDAKILGQDEKNTRPKRNNDILPAEYALESLFQIYSAQQESKEFANLDKKDIYAISLIASIFYINSVAKKISIMKGDVSLAKEYAADKGGTILNLTKVCRSMLGVDENMIALNNSRYEKFLEMQGTDGGKNKTEYFRALNRMMIKSDESVIGDLLTGFNDFYLRREKTPTDLAALEHILMAFENKEVYTAFGIYAYYAPETADFENDKSKVLDSIKMAGALASEDKKHMGLIALNKYLYRQSKVGRELKEDVENLQAITESIGMDNFIAACALSSAKSVSELPQDMKAGQIKKMMEMFNEFGIEHYERFAPEILQQQYDFMNNKEKGKSVLVILGKSDYNGAFESHESIYLSLIEKGYRPIFCEAKEEDEFAERFMHGGTLKGSKYAAPEMKYAGAIFGGHGEPWSLNLDSKGGEKGDVGLEDFMQNKGWEHGSFANKFENNAFNILISCSTGGNKGGKKPPSAENIQNLMQMMWELGHSETNDITVFAPTVPTNISNINFDENNYVIGVNWNSAAASANFNLKQKLSKN